MRVLPLVPGCKGQIETKETRPRFLFLKFSADLKLKSDFFDSHGLFPCCFAFLLALDRSLNERGLHFKSSGLQVNASPAPRPSFIRDCLISPLYLYP